MLISCSMWRVRKRNACYFVRNRYLHGDTTTPMGKKRTADGHPSTYGGFWFELGNEQTVPLFGSQVNGHTAFVTTGLSAAAAVLPSDRVQHVSRLSRWKLRRRHWELAAKCDTSTQTATTMVRTNEHLVNLTACLLVSGCSARGFKSLAWHCNSNWGCLIMRVWVLTQ